MHRELFCNQNNGKESDKLLDTKEQKSVRNINDMSIEEAREAEKTFDAELQLFRETASLNRKQAE